VLSVLTEARTPEINTFFITVHEHPTSMAHQRDVLQINPSSVRHSQLVSSRVRPRYGVGLSIGMLGAKGVPMTDDVGALTWRPQFG